MRPAWCSATSRRQNVGYQWSSLGVLWIVLIIHLVNAGFAVFRLMKADGGEMVLCFLVVCLFSLGKWVASCNVTPTDSGDFVDLGSSGSVLNSTGNVASIDQNVATCSDTEGGELKDCKAMSQGTLWRNYPLEDGQVLQTSAVYPASNEKSRRCRDRKAEPRRRRQREVNKKNRKPGMRPVCNNQGSDWRKNVAGRRGVQIVKMGQDFDCDGPKMSTSFSFVGPPGVELDNDDAKAESDEDVLARDSFLQKPRIAPVDIYPPEAYFYCERDKLRKSDASKAAIPTKSFTRPEPVAYKNQDVEIKDCGNVATSYQFNAKSSIDQVTCRPPEVRTVRPRLPYQEQFKADGPIKRSKIRSFSPMPANAGDPFQPTKDCPPPPASSSVPKFVVSTRGLAERARLNVAPQLPLCTQRSGLAEDGGRANFSPMDPSPSEVQLASEGVSGPPMKYITSTAEINRKAATDTQGDVNLSGYSDKRFPVEGGESGKMQVKRQGNMNGATLDAGSDDSFVLDDGTRRPSGPIAARPMAGLGVTSADSGGFVREVEWPLRGVATPGLESLSYKKRRPLGGKEDCCPDIPLRRLNDEVRTNEKDLGPESIAAPVMMHLPKGDHFRDGGVPSSDDIHEENVLEDAYFPAGRCHLSLQEREDARLRAAGLKRGTSVGRWNGKHIGRKNIPLGNWIQDRPYVEQASKLLLLLGLAISLGFGAYLCQPESGTRLERLFGGNEKLMGYCAAASSYIIYHTTKRFIQMPVKSH